MLNFAKTDIDANSLQISLFGLMAVMPHLHQRVNRVEQSRRKYYKSRKLITEIYIFTPGAKLKRYEQSNNY